MRDEEMFTRTYVCVRKRQENGVIRAQQPIGVPNEQTGFLPVLKQSHEFPEIKQNRAIFVRMKKSKDFIKVRKKQSYKGCTAARNSGLHNVIEM